MSSLLVIHGAQIGARFRLQRDIMTIGRDEENSIHLVDPNVSRFHAEIFARRTGHLIRDRQSRNGIYVNGRKLEDAELRRNDLILMGSTQMVYDAEPDLENALYSSKMVMLGTTSGETLQAQTIPVDGMASDESTRSCVELLTLFGRMLATTQDSLPDLLRDLLTLLQDLFKAERGAIFLWDPLNQRLEPAVVVCDGDALTADQSLLRQVIHDRQAVLASDVAPDLSLLKELERPSSPYIGSLMAAPIMANSRIDGVIMLDHRDRDRFSLRDVALLKAVGALLSGVTETNRLRIRLGLSMPTPDAQHPRIIGKSPAMVDLMEKAAIAAQHDVSILIVGDTGTGKEVLARQIHQMSRRASGPFVPVNCGAIPTELFESEFFGHERGAFTGAVRLKRGKVEMAHGGTLFLDEIGELPMTHQPKLLRFLQDGCFHRVGGTKSLRVNVRIIAATHINLEQRALLEQFRWDLFFRLNVVRLRLPPLCERREDIPLLVQQFIAVLSPEMRKTILGVSDRALEALKSYDWPGNVRELHNMIERAIILTRGSNLEMHDFPLAPPPPKGLGDIFYDIECQASRSDSRPRENILPLARVEKEYIRKAMILSHNNQAQAARSLGIHRNTLRNKLVEYGLL